MRECPFSSVPPDPLTVLAYVAAGAATLLLIMLLANAMLRMSRTRK